MATGSDEELLDASEKTKRSQARRPPTEWLSLAVLAVITLIVVVTWGYAAWWIGSMALGWIR